MDGKIVIGKGQITDGYGRTKTVSQVPEDVHEYEKVLARHGWDHVPTRSMLRLYTSCAYPGDRVQLLNGVWSHGRHQGEGRLIAPQGKGNSPHLLDTYLRVHFKQAG